MRRFILGALAALCLAPIAQAGVGVVSVQIIPSGNGKLYSAFPNGDGPDDPGTTCDVPSGWACADIGTGSGTIDQQSSTEWDFDVIGNSATTANRIAYKDAGASDVQFSALFTDSYQGSSDNFAGIGIGIREGLGDTDYQFLCFSPQASASAIRVLYGEDGTYTGVNGGAGLARPRYCGITYDLSSCTIKAHASADGSTWTEVASTTKCLGDAIAFATGQSGSTTVGLQATLSVITLGATIDIYTPTDPGGGGAPTLDTQIPNQSLAQNVVFNSCFAANFSDPDDDTLTYSADLPAGTGLSFNTTTGCFSGFPDADDVSASPYNVEICAADGVDGEACDISQFSVSASPGNILTISSGTSTVDCDTFESGGKVDPGDILQLPGGTRGPLTIRDCVGTPTNRITLRNDPDDTEPAVISGASGNILVITGSTEYFDVDGSGKYVGADSGSLGVTVTGTSWTLGRTQAGIIVENSGGAGSPTSMIQFKGLSDEFALRGVEVDGGSEGATICVQVNDHTVPASSAPGVDRDFLIENNYLHDCGNSGGVGLYQGWPTDDIPLGDVINRYNIIERTGFDCSNIKSAHNGDSEVHHSYYADCTVSTADPHGTGLDIGDGGNIRIYSNKITNTDWQCIRFSHRSTTPDGPDKYIEIFNNILHECGVAQGEDAIRIGRDVDAYEYSPVTVYNNTIVSAGGSGILVNNQTGVITRDNIIVDVGGAAVTNATSTNNRTGTIVSQAFVNAGADNFELTVDSPACNSAPGSTLDVDYEGESRPLDGVRDQGADEAAACP